MAIFVSTHHFIFIFIFIIITCSTSTLSTNELATKLCKSTTNSTFCHHVIYSDPRASDADRYVLSYIAFGQTYLNATDTYKYINTTLKSIESSGSKSQLYAAGLNKCESYYAEAVRALVETLGDLDSETFYGLDKLALDVDACARACEASFRGHSPMSNRNENLIKLSDICLAVSKLYSYF